MYVTIAQMLVQDHQHELAVEAARARLAATAKPASMHRRHTILFLAVVLLATGILVAACGGSSTTIAYPAVPVDGAPDGAQLYEGACASCHGSLGEGGLSGVPLDGFSAADRQLIIGAIRRGVGGMPASSDGMSDAQIEAIVEYVAGLR